jgi:hypothetical protein
MKMSFKEEIHMSFKEEIHMVLKIRRKIVGFTFQYDKKLLVKKGIFT